MSNQLTAITNEPKCCRHEADYAGFWLRLVAHIIDGFIAPVFAVPIVLIGVIPFCFFHSIWSDAPDWVDSLGAVYAVGWILAICSSGLLYFAWFESSPLQATPGKMAVGLIVTDLDGERISFWQAVGRNSAKFLSYLCLYIGFILAAFTDRKQALHDMMALCLVVRKPKHV